MRRRPAFTVERRHIGKRPAPTSPLPHCRARNRPQSDEVDAVATTIAESVSIALSTAPMRFPRDWLRGF